VKKNKPFPNYKTLKKCIFSHLDPLDFQSSQLSYFLFKLRDLKCYENATLSLQIILNPKGNRKTSKEVLGVWRMVA
jgi:hypothetical protein